MKSNGIYSGTDMIIIIRLFPRPSPPQLKNSNHCLRNECQRRRSIILEGRHDLLPGFLVAGTTVDARLDEDEAELGVAILPVRLEVLAHGDRLFDEVQKVLRDGLAKSYPQTKRYIECRADAEV